MGFWAFVQAPKLLSKAGELELFRWSLRRFMEGPRGATGGNLRNWRGSEGRSAGARGGEAAPLSEFGFFLPVNGLTAVWHCKAGPGQPSKHQVPGSDHLPAQLCSGCQCRQLRRPGCGRGDGRPPPGTRDGIPPRAWIPSLPRIGQLRSPTNLRMCIISLLSLPAPCTLRELSPLAWT